MDCQIWQLIRHVGFIEIRRKTRAGEREPAPARTIFNNRVAARPLEQPQARPMRRRVVVLLPALLSAETQFVCRRSNLRPS